MKSNRVYLAKTTLASGLDVQYVKSNLLRIPGIEVVGFGTGFKPHECACVVIVGAPIEPNKMFISPNILAVLSQFPDIESIFVYTGQVQSAADDVESSKPICSFVDFWEEDTLGLDIEDFCLLNSVSAATLARKDSWKPIPRFLTPKKKYAMKPIPPVDDRRSHKIAKSYQKSKDDNICEEKSVPKEKDSAQVKKFSDGAPLLRKRRR